MKTRRTILFGMLLAVAMLCAAGCTKTNEAEASGTFNGHEYVDLGLPSGTLWATCNIGAASPEEHGDYFAWGETKPKDAYNWENYKYCDGTFNQLTKYCTNAGHGYNGFTDHLTYLMIEDDAASVNWGMGWRTPTKEQWEELIENTTNTLTRWNGVKGRLFTASNGRSVFLPSATGKPHEDDYLEWDDCGLYWSASLYTRYNFSEEAWYLDSSNNYHAFISSSSRRHGLFVRPVCSIIWNK